MASVSQMASHVVSAAGGIASQAVCDVGSNADQQQFQLTLPENKTAVVSNNGQSHNRHSQSGSTTPGNSHAMDP